MKYDFRKLKAAREQRLLTQVEVAKLAGISHAAVSNVEAGNAPWIKAIRKIAAVLEVRDVIIPTKTRKTRMRKSA